MEDAAEVFHPLEGVRTESSNSYCGAFGDAACVKAIVGKSLLCHQDEMDVNLIRHLVISAIRRGRAWLCGISLAVL